MDGENAFFFKKKKEKKTILGEKRINEKPK